MKENTKLFLKKYVPQWMVDRYFILTGNRYKKMLLGITREDIGLEIGPSHRPVAPKRDGYHVETVDYLTKAELVEHYKEHGVDIDAIEDVDYIWKSGSYSQVTGKSDYYNYIISSHSLEHTTDLIGFLQDCSNMLKDNGILSFAVPDKRYCFDAFRNVTTIGNVIDDYYEKRKHHSAGSVGEYLLNCVKKNGNLSWERENPEYRIVQNYTFVHDYPYAKTTIEDIYNNKTFVDIHQYVFTPASFTLLVEDLNVLGYTDLKIHRSFQTLGNEFIVSLMKSDSRSEPNYTKRMRLLNKIRKGR